MDPRHVAEQALALAAQLAPGAQASVRAEDGRSSYTRFAVNEATGAGDTDRASVALRIALGKRHVTASSNRADPAALRALVERAAAMAKLAPEDPEAMPVLGPQSYGPKGPTHDEATASFPHERRGAQVREAIDACGRAGVAGAGFFDSLAGAYVIASSAGLRAEHRETRAAFSMTARTPDGTGSGWAGTSSERAADLDPARLAATAIAKGTRSAKPRPLPPGRYTVVLEPEAVADLMLYFVGALDARQADEGRSFFARKGGGNRVGETLFAADINLESDPADPALPGPAFDVEGLPVPKTRWVEGGRLRALRYSRYWASKQGKPQTGLPRGYHLAGGRAASVQELVKGVQKGLLVTRFWYIRWVDPQTMLLTGLTRDGLFAIERGEVAYPVRNFRFNESPAKVLANATGLTRETFRAYGGSVPLRVPALVANDFFMASPSDAVLPHGPRRGGGAEGPRATRPRTTRRGPRASFRARRSRPCRRPPALAACTPLRGPSGPGDVGQECHHLSGRPG
ncbi:MAG TPA: TldD/PmbA family protein [Polyangiaceae bacterium]|nr:TldD/PmbA family protein [Polyangiaceae bacterium]